MKRQFIFLASLALALSVFAVPVTEKQVKSVARAFVARGNTLGELLGREAEKIDARQTANGASFYLVKMQGGGTVITSGDTDLDPIVAFIPGSEDLSTLDARHPLWALLNGDLSFRQEMLNAVASAPVVSLDGARLAGAVRGNRGEWEALLSEDESRFALPLHLDGKVPAINPWPSSGDLRVGKLLEMTWSQSGKGENECTPNNYVCGCVATAMAQLMRYYQFPTAEVAPFSKTCQVDGKKVEKTAIAGTYDWANMPPEGGATDEQKQAIGKLTYDCGVSVGMMWAEAGSGAVTKDVSDALKTYFGYANTKVALNYNGLSMTDQNLGKIVYASLDAGSPVELGINNNGSDGHAVVGDGYGFVDGVSYVHLNMGWSGTGDAWYHFPDIDYRSTWGGSLYSADTVHTCIYNVFPQAEGAVISGRTLDDEGRPMGGAVVSVSAEDGTVVANLTTTSSGVWAAILPSGRYTVSAVSADGKCAGEWPDPIALGSDNVWGLDFEVSDPSVRVNGELFVSLDAALAAVTDGCEIEVLKATELRRSQVVGVNCTIRAVEDASAAAVLVKEGASLSLSNDVRVLFKNVVFTNAAQNVVIEVASNATAAVSGLVGVQRFVTADETGFEIAGALEAGLELDCAVSKELGNQFGTYSCELDAAERSAARIVNVYDDYGEIRGQAQDGKLVWAEIPVPLADAVGFFVDSEDLTNTAARLDRAFEKFEAAIAANKFGDGRPELVILKAGSLSRPLTISADAVIRGENGVTISDLGPSAGFTITNGTLTVSNLVFDGYTGNALFLVDGGALELSDCELYHLNGTNDHSGAVAVLKGSGVITNTVIGNCRATGAYSASRTKTSNGGAVTLKGEGCDLRLLDAVITNCWANGKGGAVYVAKDATVSLGGVTQVKGNLSGKTTLLADDFYLCNAATVLKVASPLKGGDDAVGVRYYGSTGNAAGQVFAVIDYDLPANPDAAATEYRRDCAAFLNNVNVALKASDPDGEKMRMAWSEIPVMNPEDPTGAKCRLLLSTSERNGYYRRVSDAFAAATDGSEIELLDNDEFSGDLIVSNCLVLKTAESKTAFALTRAAQCSVSVVAGGQLTVANVRISGSGPSKDEYAVPLVAVNGGELILGRNAIVCRAFGKDRRDANAVTVWNSGSITMLPGSGIESSRNSYNASKTSYGDGGGLLVANHSVAHLKGGRIYDCAAANGNGALINSSSEVYVSGDFTIGENGPSWTNAEINMLTVSDNSQLYLDDALTGQVRFCEGVQANTSVFGRVSWPTTNLSEVNQSAAAFLHGATGVRGTVVTNATEKLLVWKSSVAADGSYTDAWGRKYYAPVYSPTDPVEPLPFKVALTLDAEGKVHLLCDPVVEGCWYSVWSTDNMSASFIQTGAARQIRVGEEFVVERDPGDSARFYKVIAEPGVK